MLKRRFIGLVLPIMLTVIPMTVIGAEARKLDLKAAVNMGLEQNLDLKIEELNLEKAELEYRKKKANNLLSQSRYSELEAKYTLAAAQNTYQNVHDNLVKNIIQQYTNIWLSELDLEIKDRKVKLEKLLLEAAKAHYEIGDIGSIDLLEQENAYKDAQFNLEIARDDYQRSVKEFKTLLGLNEIKPVLAGLEPPRVWAVTEEQAIHTALENSIELKLKNEEVELAELDLERAKISAPELDRRIKEVALEIARTEKESIQEEIINSTQQVYYQLKQAVKKMNLKKESLTEAKEKYNLRKEQYKAGLIAETEVLQYEVNMMETEYQYKSAIADYYLQEQSLRQAMNLELGVFMNDNPKEK